MVTATIGLDHPGKQIGQLRVPRVTNTSGWSNLTVPLGCVAVAPCLSLEASRAYTRLWPSGANLNRSFPGAPDGTLDEQLAEFVTRELIARADVVIDIHSGGRSGLCLPWAEMHWVEDREQRRAMVEGMLAWGTDWCVVYIDIAGGGLLVGEAERQRKIVVSTELGGGGHVTAEIHRLARSGLENVLRTVGVLAGEPRPPRDGTRILMATGLEDYVLAPESGLFETLVDLGDAVDPGRPVGRIHFLERPDRQPVEIAAATSGTVCVVRAIATTEQGDNVCVIGREVTREDLL